MSWRRLRRDPVEFVSAPNASVYSQASINGVFLPMKRADRKQFVKPPVYIKIISLSPVFFFRTLTLKSCLRNGGCVGITIKLFVCVP